jgi:transposase
LFDRVEELAPEAIPAEPLTKALNYLVNQKTALYTYTEDGRLEIDNNTAENAIRPLALGRKNYLFAGSQAGGNAAALYLSLVESCRQNGVDPWKYFRDVFSRIMAHRSSKLRELLPDRWKPPRTEAPP